MRPSPRPLNPLDGPALEQLALRYVGRFATTRARLVTYLRGKVRARGFDGDVPDLNAIAERFAAAGYIDDLVFGAARAREMARKGLGARRVAGALHHAGIDEDDCETLAPDIADQALAAALVFARKRRIGPFASAVPDRATRERQIAAMLRAGHEFAVVRRILAMAPGDDPASIGDKD